MGKAHTRWAFLLYRTSLGGGLRPQVLVASVNKYKGFLTMASISPDETIKAALSAARLGTFEAAISPSESTLKDALALYAWNAQVSAAMLAPLHMCEVVIRNAVSDALIAVYGAQWPWEPAFRRSLPNPPRRFSALRELNRACTDQTRTSKVVAELKMIFWQKMFTGRFDTRLWNAHLRAVMPNMDESKTVQDLRRLIHEDLEQLRKLRNRIAHHEPIFSRALDLDFLKIQELIAFRCLTTSNWMTQNQQAQALISTRPT
jgi:hypothetical protein